MKNYILLDLMKVNEKYECKFNCKKFQKFAVISTFFLELEQLGQWEVYSLCKMSNSIASRLKKNYY